MKLSFKRLFALAIVLTQFGCNLDPNPINTKEETINATIGKWKHADLEKSDVRYIVFSNRKDDTGNYICTFIFKKKNNLGTNTSSDSWRYVDVGKIEILSVGLSLPVNLIDKQTFDLNENDIYTKEK